MKSPYTDEFLESLGNWQKGWREKQGTKDELASNLELTCRNLPSEVKSAPQICYRKRFLHHGEMVDIFLRDEKHEGIASWTTEQVWAERFKGLRKANAITAAIFRHVPTPDEIIVNVPALWSEPDFVLRTEEFRESGAQAAEAIWNFRASQSEVVLRAELRGSEAIALVGLSSAFDDICEAAGFAEGVERDNLFRTMTQEGEVFEQPRWLGEEGVKRVIKNSILALERKIEQAKARKTGRG